LVSVTSPRRRVVEQPLELGEALGDQLPERGDVDGGR
jgi:hypothetical protein